MQPWAGLWPLNSGRVRARLGAKEKAAPAQTPVSFVPIDNHHLAETGVRYFCARSKQLVIATSNPGHPAFQVSEPNLHVSYQSKPDLRDLLEQLGERFGCERLTIPLKDYAQNLLRGDD